MNIGHVMALNARRHPEKLAVTCEGRTYSYKQFNEEVNRLANGLIELGIEKGQNIALFMKNSDHFAIAFFAMMKVGAVAVPINFRLTVSETRYILDQSESVLIFCDEEFAALIEEARDAVTYAKYVVVVGTPSIPAHLSFREVMSEDEREPNVEILSSDDAEILYTSGTTGKPKGVLLDHQRIMNVNTVIMLGMRMNEQDRLLHVAPLFHSAQLNLFLLTGFFMGASHVIHRDFHPVEALTAIQEHKITLFFGVPIMYNFFLQVPNAENFDISSVTRCGYGAAPMAPELIRKSIDLFQTDQFYNLCGLTEGGPGGIFLRPEEHTTKVGKGGKAMFLTEARVVNELMEDVEPGQIGEFILRGETVMKEYYRKPEETAKAFVDGWLLTGDLAEIDEDGYITLVDRKKDMIISGGENVYSVEVEQIMYEHPQVLEAATIGIPDETWGEKVIAIVVPKEGEVIDEEDFIQFCRKHLAGYKVPKQIEIVEQLPRNASGKILKYQLRKEFSPTK